ncbi:MAG: hypothetical protein KJ737_19525 [Proteobacteria bacterium]|nr:hypothetical protein [Pseudomonadota bacterium]
MDKIILTVELTKSEADSFCKFCSRTYFDIFKELSTSEAEAYQMRDSLYTVWKALTDG